MRDGRGHTEHVLHTVNRRVIRERLSVPEPPPLLDCANASTGVNKVNKCAAPRNRMGLHLGEYRSECNTTVVAKSNHPQPTRNTCYIRQAPVALGLYSVISTRAKVAKRMFRAAFYGDNEPQSARRFMMRVAEPRRLRMPGFLLALICFGGAALSAQEKPPANGIPQKLAAKRATSISIPAKGPGWPRSITRRQVDYLRFARAHLPHARWRWQSRKSYAGLGVALNMQPRYSPDGKTIAFISVCPDAAHDVMRSGVQMAEGRAASYR